MDPIHPIQNLTTYKFLDQLVVPPYKSSAAEGLDALGSRRTCRKSAHRKHTHRIHGAAIYDDIGSINIPQSC